MATRIFCDIKYAVCLGYELSVMMWLFGIELVISSFIRLLLLQVFLVCFNLMMKETVSLQFVF